MLENFLTNWNGKFSDYELQAADLKEPQVLMGALIKVFDRLGIDRAVLGESPEDNVNDSMQYYRDLLPVINVTRTVNYFMSMMPQNMLTTISMTHLLQPTVSTSQAILLLLFNLMAFHEEKLQDIEPYEQELFQQSEQVKKLEERNYKLKELLNERAQEKALRADRLEQLDASTKQQEEELKEETAACNAALAELDAASERRRALGAELAARRAQLDAALAAADKKRALRVRDADDVTAQVEQAARDVAELDERLAATRATLVEKDDCLKNLHGVKPALDGAAGLLRDVARLADTLMELECGDLDCDSQEGELTVLQTELAELQAAGRELQAARLDAQAAAQAARSRRHQEQAAAQSALREATEKSKKNSELSERVTRKTEEIKTRTLQYEEQKARGLQDITDIHDDWNHRLQFCQDMLMKQLAELAQKVENKQNNKNKHNIK